MIWNLIRNKMQIQENHLPNQKDNLEVINQLEWLQKGKYKKLRQNLKICNNNSKTWLVTIKRRLNRKLITIIHKFHKHQKSNKKKLINNEQLKPKIKKDSRKKIRYKK